MSKRSSKVPEDLKPGARDRWMTVYPQLAKRGAVDVTLLKTYCQVFERWREAEDQIAKRGTLMTTPNGRIAPSPLVAIAKQAHDTVQALEQKLGVGTAAPPQESADGPVSTSSVLLTRRQLAAAFDVDPLSVTRWEMDGMPVAKRFRRGKNTLFDLEAVRAWRELTQARDVDTLSLSAERARLAQLQGEKLTIDIARRREELLPRDQVIREGQAFGKALQAKVRSLPRRAAQLGIITLAQVGPLEKMCRELLNDLGSMKTIADADRVVKDSALV